MKFVAPSLNLASDSPVQVLAPNRMRVGKKTVALGLLWQPVRSQLSLRDQAEMAGAQGSEFDLAAHFDEQLGFGMRSEGLGAGMLAGASLLDTRSLGDTWLAVFPLELGRLWWIVAMRDGKIYEDRVLDEETDARAALVKSLEAPGWGKVVSPSNWGIDNSEEADLSELLSFRQATRLRLVDRRPQIGIGIALTAIVAGITVFAWVQFSKHRDAEKLRVEAYERSRSVPDAERPWARSPHVADFVSTCVSSMNRVSILALGWVQQPIICRWAGAESTVATSWRRNAGRIPYLRAAVADRVGSRIELSSNGDGASLSVPVAFPASTAKTNPWPAWRIEAILRERFQTLGLDLNMTARVYPPGNADAASGIGRFRNRHDIGVATSVSINEYAKLLSDVPALVPESLVFRPEANVWLLTAKAYHEGVHPPLVQQQFRDKD